MATVNVFGRETDRLSCRRRCDTRVMNGELVFYLHGGLTRLLCPDCQNIVADIATLCKKCSESIFIDHEGLCAECCHYDVPKCRDDFLQKAATLQKK